MRTEVVGIGVFTIGEQKSGSSMENQRRHQTYLLTPNKVKCGRMSSSHFRGLTRKTVFSAGKVEGLIDYKLNMGEFVYNGGFQRSYWERLKDRSSKTETRSEKIRAVRGCKYEEAEITMGLYIFDSKH